MKIGLASDHGGFKTKEKLTRYLSKLGYHIIDYGTDSNNSVDYPDFAFKVSEATKEKKVDLGIIICKTGIGMCIAANKVKGIRCAKLDNKNEAKYAREHNDANVIAISGNKNFFFIKRIINSFLNASNNIEDRHKKRIDKISRYEDEH